VFAYIITIQGRDNIVMKLSEIWLGFGFGAAIGLLGGALAMNNCRKMRQKVEEMQSVVVDKIEEKKRQAAQSKLLQGLRDDMADGIEDVSDSVIKKLKK